MDRLAMAEALVRRAAKHAAWIGDDHGDPYEAAMLSGKVDEEIQIVTKELLDHLRAALDYCARQVWAEVSGIPVSTPIYFPIAREKAKLADVASLMNARMPGVPATSSEILVEFASMQEFANPANVWLSELAILSNTAKHEHLQIASIPEALLHNRRDHMGKGYFSFEPGHGPKRHTPWMLLRPSLGDTAEKTTYQASYLVLAEINVELSNYLKEALAGVDGIISRCRRSLRVLAAGRIDI